MNLIIAGTNRPNNKSEKVADYYLRELQRLGQEWEVLFLGDLPDQLIASDLYGKRSEAFAAIQEKVSRAQKFVFVIPEYNGSYPGVLKVFMDACAFPASFFNKKAALVGISTGKYGNVRGVDHFTGVCNYMRMHVMPLKLHISHIQNELDGSGNFHEPLTVKYVQEQIEEIARF